MALVGIHNEPRGTLLGGARPVGGPLLVPLEGPPGAERAAPGRGHGGVVPCWSVHTFFLRFPIDVVYVDRQHTVAKTVSALKPFRACAGSRGAHCALEVPADTVRESGTCVSDQLRFEEA